ncbi:hypothetical protein ACFU5O_16750 [Streptomyces sp. NPDC057445]|uniref:hypothetical protein n=1 Tax=Streptomyces sp. NPDC057445 TaxID=3346136 RepID=UPI00367B9344
MTHATSATVLSEAAPVAWAGRSRSPTGSQSTGRVSGLDLNHGPAVRGMHASHLGPEPAVGGPAVGWKSGR